jgi:hypothetical protein
VIAGPWKDWDDHRKWWAENSIEINKLSVTDPEEWERVTRKIEAFLASVPWTPERVR